MRAGLVGVAALLCIGVVSVANAASYTLTDLGPGVAYGINDAGQVVGFSQPGGGPQQRGAIVLYQKSAFNNIGVQRCDPTMRARGVDGAFAQTRLRTVDQNCCAE